MYELPKYEVAKHFARKNSCRERVTRIRLRAVTLSQKSVSRSEGLALPFISSVTEAGLSVSSGNSIQNAKQG